MTANPLNAIALEILDAATEVYEKARREKTSEAGVEANQKLKGLQERAAKELKDGKAGGRSTKKLEEVADRVKAMNAEIVKACLGI